MGYRLTIRSDHLPTPTNITENWHWRKRSAYRKTWRLWVKYAVGRKRPRAPLERARVLVDVYATKRADRMNLRHSFKPVIDGLCPERAYMRKGKRVVSHGAGVIRDDSPDVIGEPSFHWHEAQKGAEHFVLTVEEDGPHE